MSVARYWHPVDDLGDIVCTLCPRNCRLRPGQPGVCHARVNRDGTMRAASWGRSSDFCIDPVEKKPLNQFLPRLPVLSFGSIGCNLTCAYCQNWQISRERNDNRLSQEIPPEEIARAAAIKGCRSVAVTYNEPIIALEYAVEVAAACHAQRIRAVAVTAGYIAAEARAEFFTAFNAVNIDLKAFSDDFYRDVCGARLEPVLDSLRFVARETKTWLEVTALLIPGLNDSDAEIAALSRFIATELSPDVPLHFSAFRPAHKMLRVPPTPPETLTRARGLAMAEGLRFVYTGNVHDIAGGTTFCPGCGAAAIHRDWYEIRNYALDSQGYCTACGTRIPGVFDGKPGVWGRRREPLNPPIFPASC